MNETSWISTALEHLGSVETWFNSAGPGVKVMALCIIGGYFLKVSFSKLPSKPAARWLIFLIPFFIVVGSGLAFPLLSGETETPLSVLRINGAFYGLASWALHALVLARIIDKRLFRKDDDGDTVFITKGKEKGD